MKLVIKWGEFKCQLKEFIKEVDRLLDLKNGGKNTYDVETFLKVSNNWVRNCHNYLKLSFDDINNEYAQNFITAKPYNSYLKNENRDLISKIENVFEDLKTKRNSLNYTLRILSVSDIVIEPKLVDKQIRTEYTNYEISDLILDKLYHLYDNHFYPVQAILRGNGIKFSNTDELDELIKLLEKNSYINAIYSRSVNAQLSLKGRKHVEKKRRFELIDKFYFSSNQELLNEEISELDNNANKTELGKTRLVKELKEMKSLYHKLNKKNWPESLKDKLIDLEIANLINRDAMKRIYQSMTNDDAEFI